MASAVELHQLMNTAPNLTHCASSASYAGSSAVEAATATHERETVVELPWTVVRA